MKKLLGVLPYLIKLILLISMILVHHFTKIKMGMSRYMVYINGIIDSFLGGYGRGKIALFIISIVMFIMFLVRIIEYKVTINNKISLEQSLMILISIVFVAYSIFLDRSVARDYYLIGIILTLLNITNFIMIKKVGKVSENE